MNRIFKILILLCLALVHLKCKPDKKNILISQEESTEPIIIRLTLKDSTIFGMKIPNKLEFQNKSFFNKSFISVDYLYSDSLTKWRNLGIELYEIDNQKLKRVSNNKKKTITKNKSLEYVYYTRHFVDSSRTTQQQFKPYIEKMLAENKDTLHIGTVSEFKQRHKNLFEKLTKRDSISIRLLGKSKFRERISVPVRW